MTEVQFAKQFLTTLDSKNAKYQSDHVFDPRTFQMRIPYTLPKLAHPPHPLPPKPTTTTTPAPGSQPTTSTTTIASPPATIDLTLKSTRNPTFTLHLPSLPPTTPITTLKSQIQSLLQGSISTDKIKILHNKKPIPASKVTVYDVLSTTSSSDEGSAEFGVMILGGASDPSPQTQTVSLAGEMTVQAPGPGSENAAVEAVTGINPEDVVKQQNRASPLAAPVEMEGVTSRLQQEQDRERASEPVQPGERSGSEVLRTPEFWDDLQGFLEQRLRDGEEARRLRGLFERVVGGS